MANDRKESMTTLYPSKAELKAAKSRTPSVVVTSDFVCTVLGQPTKQHATRGTDTDHASREPSEFTNRIYRRSGGASIQNWLITFPSQYNKFTIEEITNADVRWSTWEESSLTVGEYERTGNTLHISGGAGVVVVRYKAEFCELLQTVDSI